MDIRLSRLVQIVQVLNVTDDIRRIELEWQAKLVASAVASTVEDAEYRDKLVAQINSKNLRNLDEEDPSAPSGSPADTSGDRRSYDEILANGSVEQALARNSRRKGPGLFGIGTT